MVDEFSRQIDIKYIKIPPASLSKARNVGLDLASGEYILLGDDDCWYPERTFKDLKNWLELAGFPPGVCGSTSDPDQGIGYGALRKVIPEGITIVPSNAFWYPVSITLAIKKDLFPYFDERLGLGADYYSGEESDLVLEVIKSSKIVTTSSFIAFHPYKAYQWKEAYRGGVGFGFVVSKSLKKRRQYGVLWSFWRVLVRSLGGFLVFALKGKPKRSLACLTRLGGILRGIGAGLIASHPDMPRVSKG